MSLKKNKIIVYQNTNFKNPQVFDSVGLTTTESNAFYITYDLYCILQYMLTMGKFSDLTTLNNTKIYIQWEITN